MKTVKNITLVALIAFGSMYSQEAQCNRLLGKGALVAIAGLSALSSIPWYTEYKNIREWINYLQEELRTFPQRQAFLDQAERDLLGEIRELKKPAARLTPDEHFILQEMENSLTTNGAPNYQVQAKTREEEEAALRVQRQQEIARYQQQYQRHLLGMMLAGISCCGASYLFFNK